MNPSILLLCCSAVLVSCGGSQAARQTAGPCSLASRADGSQEISCSDGTVFVPQESRSTCEEEQGAPGRDGSSCRVTSIGSGSALIECEDGSSSLVYAKSLQAVTFDSSETDSFADDIVGFRFTVLESPLWVTELGFYDHGNDGLADEHSVGLFEVLNGKLLAKVTIPSGVDSALIDGYRYVPITPIELTPHTTYVMLGYRPTASDPIPSQLVNPQTVAIRYDSEVAINESGGLRFINSPFGGSNAWLGPNFRHTSVYRAPN